MDGQYSSCHLPVVGVLRVGGWDISVFWEQRYSPGVPAEGVLVEVVHGRVRVAVVDPAINDMLSHRGIVASEAWGKVTGVLRCVADPVDALVEANRVIYDGSVGWLEGPMLCVAVTDLHPSEPLLLAAVRAGDTEVHSTGFSLKGSFLREGVGERLKGERVREGHVGSDPKRWMVQMNFLESDDYVCAPLGVMEEARLECWGPDRTSDVVVTTVGFLLDGDPADGVDFGGMLVECEGVPEVPHPVPHSDRAVVHARWREQDPRL